MTLDEIDKSGLIRESYRIPGIQASECRSIFLDWALKLADGSDQTAAVKLLIDAYVVASPDHPMNAVLQEALGNAVVSGRRGGRAGRLKL